MTGTRRDVEAWEVFSRISALGWRVESRPCDPMIWLRVPESWCETFNCDLNYRRGFYTMEEARAFVDGAQRVYEWALGMFEDETPPVIGEAQKEPQE